jgi:hypothetical protein
MSRREIDKIIQHYEDNIDYDFVDGQYVFCGKDWQDCVYEVMGKDFKDYEFLAEKCEEIYMDKHDLYKRIILHTRKMMINTPRA